MGGYQYPRSTRVAALDELFADNLYAARRKLRIPRRELADLTGIPASSIEKIETGHRMGGGPGKRRKVAIGEAIVLAEALGLKPGDLLRAREADRG